MISGYPSGTLPPFDLGARAGNPLGIYAVIPLWILAGISLESFLLEFCQAFLLEILRRLVQLEIPSGISSGFLQELYRGFFSWISFKDFSRISFGDTF